MHPQIFKNHEVQTEFKIWDLKDYSTRGPIY